MRKGGITQWRMLVWVVRLNLFNHITFVLLWNPKLGIWIVDLLY